jgi:hypothetical protein
MILERRTTNQFAANASKGSIRRDHPLRCVNPNRRQPCSVIRLRAADELPLDQFPSDSSEREIIRSQTQFRRHGFVTCDD